MKVDVFGVAHHSTNDICNLLYENPQLDLHEIQVDDPEDFNRSIDALFYKCDKLPKYRQRDHNIERPFAEELEEFDLEQQANWYMPDEYKQLDIAKWLLDQCHSDAEMQRIGKELLMFQERNLLVLLQFMKYLVDTMRDKNVVWGVGRGSSTASYCLFLIGVHRIDSLFYGLEIEEFLK